ncbi:MAG: hypothetical protein WBD36_01065 [Bacteroidota bacterium]
MRNGRFFSGCFAILSAIWIVGCSKSVTGPENFQDVDKQALEELILAEPLLTSDASALNDDGVATAMEVGSLGKAAAAIYPRGWGRRITSASRSISFEQANDSTVIGTVTYTLTGVVLIRAKYSLQSSTDTVIAKPFTETTTHKVRFVRVANTAVPRANWRMREVSAVKGGTSGSQVTIVRLTVVMGSDTVDVSDPNDYFLKLGFRGRGGVPEVPPSPTQPVSVQVTVVSSDPDTDMVSLHRPAPPMTAMLLKPMSARMQLISQTQSGTSYTRVYGASWQGVFLGRHTMFVSALTRSSIFDDQAPFSSQIWGVPFIVQ